MLSTSPLVFLFLVLWVATAIVQLVYSQFQEACDKPISKERFTLERYKIGSIALQLEQFSKYLQSLQMKLTPERRRILESTLKMHTHFEADDLLFQMRKNGIRVSKATIYRTLPLLVKSGLLRELHDDDRHMHYEHVYGHKHHEHLICLNCGKIIEFTELTIEEIQEEICKQHGFTPIKHRYEILGYCAKCSKEAG